MEQVDEIIDLLQGLKEELSIPRNVKEKIDNTIEAMKSEMDIKIKVNKALQELDEIADDPNIEAYTRTMIWNIVSLLEKLS